MTTYTHTEVLKSTSANHFVSHYWDCRLKGRPTGTPLTRGKKTGETEGEVEKRKRKRKVRERDLCDVKIKVTEFFGKEELEALRKLGLGTDINCGGINEGQANDFTFSLEGSSQVNSKPDNADLPFGLLELTQKYPDGHPGTNGRRWYMVQRVSGNDREADAAGDHDLDHKHTLEESDRIKKNSVQRWVTAKEKEKKKQVIKTRQTIVGDDDNNEGSDDNATPGTNRLSVGLRSGPSPSRFHASGSALQTLYNHGQPTSNGLTFYGNSLGPFCQRVWITLEYIGVPYRHVEVTESDWSLPLNPRRAINHVCNIPELVEINPECNLPCIRHNDFGVWESLVIMEYLEDLAMGHSLFMPAVGNAQLKAHSRLWVDFINRRILPVFYGLLLTPDGEVQHTSNRMPDTAATNGSSNQATRSLYDTEPLPQQQAFMPSAGRCDPLPISSHNTAYNATSTTIVPQSERTQTLITTLLSTITTLVDASHQTGPFFLGPSLSYVDIAFAPWIIRLSRVLSYYRDFPRPEVGTRWQQWCDAIENNEVVKRTISEDNSYREVYRGARMIRPHTPPPNNSEQDNVSASNVGWYFDEGGWLSMEEALKKDTTFPEMDYARKIVRTEGFGMGGDVWGRIAGES